MRYLLIIYWLWQSAVKTPEPQLVSANYYFYLLLAGTALLSFIFGALVTAIYFVSVRPKNTDQKASNQSPNEPSRPRISIKQCPKCHSTYTDESLKYCLRDGLTLKSVGSMPVPLDPDQTTEFKR